MADVIPFALDSSQRLRVLQNHNTLEVRNPCRNRCANMHIYSPQVHITLPFQKGNASEVRALNLRYIPALTPFSALALQTHANAQQQQQRQDRPVAPLGVRSRDARWW